MSLTTHHLYIIARVSTPLELDEQSGSALRRAISEALWGRFCANKDAPKCAECVLVRVCPVATLVAPMREGEQQGDEQSPRPYVVRPPHGHVQHYDPGETLQFGLGLFGPATDLFPFLLIAVDNLERGGLGRKLEVNQGQRGTVQVEQIVAVHPLTEQTRVLYQRGSPLVQIPGLPVQPAQVAAYAAGLPPDRLTIHFKTPLRLVHHQRLVKQIALQPLLQQLIMRLDALCQIYGSGPLELDVPRLLELAKRVSVVDDRTCWVDVINQSFLQHRRISTGGLIGRATFVGDLTELRTLLVWGSLLHVGQNAVKGGGWYEIER